MSGTVELTGIVDRTVEISSVINSFVDDTSYPACMSAGGEVLWPAIPALDNIYTKGSYTIEGWFRIDEFDPVDKAIPIIYKFPESAPFGGWHIRATLSGGKILMWHEMSFSLDASQWVYVESLAVMDVGVWNHFAITYDPVAPDLRFWINGTDQTYLGFRVFPSSSDSSANDSSQQIHIGGFWDSPFMSNFNGGIGWVQIHNNVKYTTAFTPPSRTTIPTTDSESLFLMGLWEGVDPKVLDYVSREYGIFTANGGAVDWC